MKEINLQDLKVGDVIYNPVSIRVGWTTIGTYYREEVVNRITPKRKKIFTNFGDYKSDHVFYEKSNDIEEINKEIEAKEKIANSAYVLSNLISREKKYLNFPTQKAIYVSELLEEAADILKGDEKK